MYYWFQLCYPSDTREAAEEFDGVLWWMLEQVVDFRIQRQDGEGGAAGVGELAFRRRRQVWMAPRFNRQLRGCRRRLEA